MSSQQHHRVWTAQEGQEQTRDRDRGQIPIRRPILLLLWAALYKSGVWQLTLIIINFKGVAKIRSESSAAPKHNWDLGLYLYVSCDGHIATCLIWSERKLFLVSTTLFGIDHPYSDLNNAGPESPFGLKSP